MKQYILFFLLQQLVVDVVVCVVSDREVVLARDELKGEASKQTTYENAAHSKLTPVGVVLAVVLGKLRAVMAWGWKYRESGTLGERLTYDTQHRDLPRLAEAAVCREDLGTRVDVQSAAPLALGCC